MVSRIASLSIVFVKIMRWQEVNSFECGAKASVSLPVWQVIAPTFLYGKGVPCFVIIREMALFEEVLELIMC